VIRLLLLAVIAGVLGAYFAWKRMKTPTGTVPAPRRQKELRLYADRPAIPQPAVDLPRHIGEKKVAPISAALLEKLNRITPSQNRDMLYYPCRVVTRDGRVFDRVYVQPREPYLTHWGKLPFDDPHKGWIAISEIVDVEESPLRLPPKLAEQIYQQGETKMGVHMFRVDFRQGTSSAVMTGNAVDFIALPEGVTGADVVWVHPLTGYDEHTELGPRYYWSIYDGVEPT
jgi:hypothetical protein